MESLFENTTEPIYFNVPDAEIIYYPRFLDVIQSNLLFEELLHTIPWKQDNIKVFGKNHAQPRLTALFGNEGKSYSYSNIKMHPHSWNTLLHDLKQKVATVSATEFTTVLLNLYRNGKDSNGWHADNEKELGINPVIASMSFGAERYFNMQHIKDKNLKVKILLEHGSLLVMKGTTQHFWKHQIPKTTKSIGSRINLTFRSIV